MARTLDTWIDGELVSVDLDSIWVDTFAEWDSRVPCNVAEDIATAVERVLLAAAESL